MALQFGLPEPQTIVAIEQERLGFGVAPLAQERRAEIAHRHELRPAVGTLVSADVQAFAEEGFGLGELLLVDEVLAQGSDGAIQRSAIGPLHPADVVDHGSAERLGLGPAAGVFIDGGQTVAALVRVGMAVTQRGAAHRDRSRERPDRLVVQAQARVHPAERIEQRALDSLRTDEPIAQLGRRTVEYRGHGDRLVVLVRGVAAERFDEELSDSLGLAPRLLRLLQRRVGLRLRGLRLVQARFISASACPARTARYVPPAAAATSSPANAAAIASVARCRRASLPSWYHADGGPASTASPARYRSTSPRQAVGRLVPPRPVLLQALHRDPVQLATHQLRQPRRLDARDARRSRAAESPEWDSRVEGRGVSSSRISRAISA